MSATEIFAYSHHTMVEVEATPEKVFAFLDDQKNLSAHMEKSSWMMAGSSMKIEMDKLDGRAVGSVIKMSGSVMGIPLFLQEKIVERKINRRKAWLTFGPQKMVVIDQYKMGFTLAPSDAGSYLKVFIEYNIPEKGLSRLLAFMLSGVYARWCTEKMATDAAKHFAKSKLKTQWGSRINLISSLILLGIGTFFLFFRPTLLPEDLRFMGINQLPEGTHRWLSWVFTVLGGYIFSTGLLISVVYSLKRSLITKILVLPAWFTSIGIMTAVNFVIASDFKWALAAFSVFWLSGILLDIKEPN